MSLPASWDVPSALRDRLGAKRGGRQRAILCDGHLLLVLHSLPGEDASEREAVYFWRSPDGNWQFSGRGSGIDGLREHVDAYDDAEEALRKAYDGAVDAEDYFEVLERVAPLEHASKNLHATLQAAREAVGRDRDILELRDSAYDIQRAFELLHRDTRNALDFSMARKAEEQARSGEQVAQAGHRLNILAAIFFPIATLSSVFGMNLRSGMEDSPIWVFWAVSAAGIALGYLIRGWILASPGEKR